MAYTTPKTDWATNEVVAADDMNDIGENLDALKNPPSDEYTRKGTTDYTITSTTWADVDATNLNLSLDTTGGDVLVTFTGSAYAPSAALNIEFDLDVDGVREGGSSGIVVVTTNSSLVANVSFSWWITGLSAGAHAIKLQAKLNAAGTVNLLAGGTVPSALQFVAREVS